jgi:hypothetical protein
MIGLNKGDVSQMGDKSPKNKKKQLKRIAEKKAAVHKEQINILKPE